MRNLFPLLFFFFLHEVACVTKRQKERQWERVPENNSAALRVPFKHFFFTKLKKVVRKYRFLFPPSQFLSSKESEGKVLFSEV